MALPPNFVIVWSCGQKRYAMPSDSGDTSTGVPLDAKNVEVFGVDLEPDHGVLCCEQLSGPDGIHVTLVALPFGDVDKAKAYYRRDRDVTGFKTVRAELGSMCGACGCTSFYNKVLGRRECRGCGVQ